MKLLDDKVPALLEGTQLLKALNVLMLKILDNCNRWLHVSCMSLTDSMERATKWALKFIYLKIAEHDDQATWLLATDTGTAAGCGVYVSMKYCIAAGHTPS